MRQSFPDTDLLLCHAIGPARVFANRGFFFLFDSGDSSEAAVLGETREARRVFAYQCEAPPLFFAFLFVLFLPARVFSGQWVALFPIWVQNREAVLIFAIVRARLFVAESGDRVFEFARIEAARGGQWETEAVCAAKALVLERKILK